MGATIPIIAPRCRCSLLRTVIGDSWDPPLYYEWINGSSFTEGSITVVEFPLAFKGRASARRTR